MIPCLNKAIFGLDCLGCGGQRALLLVLEGKFEAAFKMFPAIYTLLAFLLFLIINLFFKFKGDYSVKIGFILLNAGVIVLAYLLKIIPIIS